MRFALRRRSLLLAAAFGCTAVSLHAQTKSSGLPDRVPARDIQELRNKNLLFPVAGRSVDHLKDTFFQSRGRHRLHHALDIPAARGTAVLSTDSGRVLKLHRSRDGGLMIYAADPGNRFIYHYAHLDHYHKGLTEGMTLARGDTLGYVGITGNAPPNEPHLHFAILRSKNISKWSRGIPIDPFVIFAH